MSQLCVCAVGLGNTGKPNCVPLYKVAREIIYVQYFKDDGTVNEIDLSTAALDDAWWTAQINNSILSERYVPSPLLDNVEALRNDPVFETLNSGENIYVQQGTAPFVGLHVKADPALEGKYSNYKCNDIGAFIVDLDGNLIGNGKEAGVLRPIRIAPGTFYSLFVWPTDSTVQKVRVNWEWHRNECDGDLRMVTADYIPTDLLNLKGLIDVLPTDASATSTTEIVVTMNTCYGNHADPIKVKGLVDSDFDLFNVTDSLSVAVGGVVESPDGTYTITFAAQDSTDVMRVSLNKDGFDMTPFEVTIP